MQDSQDLKPETRSAAELRQAVIQQLTGTSSITTTSSTFGWVTTGYVTFSGTSATEYLTIHDPGYDMAKAIPKPTPPKRKATEMTMRDIRAQNAYVAACNRGGGEKYRLVVRPDGSVLRYRGTVLDASHETIDTITSWAENNGIRL